MTPRNTLACAALAVAALALAAPAAAQDFLPLSVGQTVSGQLEERDPVLTEGGRFRVYRFQAEPGRRYVATMDSDDFDAYLQVARTVGGITDFMSGDDDGGRGTNARLRFTVPAAGTYLLVAQALMEDGIGGFTVGLMTVEVRPPTVRDIALGQRLSGALTESDPEDDGGFYNLYRFQGTAGQRVRVRFISDEIGGSVTVGHLNGDEFVPLDDVDGGWGNVTNVTLPADGAYHVRVGAYGDVGAYTVSVEERVIVPLRPHPLRRGEDVSGTLGPGDAETDEGKWVDAYSFTLRAGEQVTITHRSSDFDAYLLLGRMTNGVFEELERDDDGGGDLNSEIVFTAPAAGEYVIQATSFSAGAEGDYVVRVEP